MKNILEVLNDNKVNLKQSVYINDKENILNFPLFVPGEFTIHDEDLYNSSFNCVNVCKNEVQRNYLNNNYKILINKIEDLSKVLKKLKLTKGDIDNEKVILLRKHKKLLAEKLNQIKLILEYRAYNKIFKDIDYPQKPMSILYENSVFISSFENICKIVPKLKNVHGNFTDDIPWFISDLNNLQEAIENKKDIGVEGGPCLFFKDEFYVILKHKDGSMKKFDYGDFTERSIENKMVKDNSTSLLEYMRLNGPNIQSVEVDCQKNDITMREYDIIKYLFEIAKGLDAKLIITIPDMSYKKIFYNIFKQLPKAVFEDTKNKFFEKFDQLTHTYLKWINILKKEYLNIDLTIFRYDEKELCEKFYKKRAEFSFKKSDLNHITKYDEFKDAIMDYIFMPALPYYLFGIKDIVEVNRLEEMHSIFKCKSKKFNKNNINITTLFPLRFSKGVEKFIYNES